jgi:hypothetical protein
VGKRGKSEAESVEGRLCDWCTLLAGEVSLHISEAQLRIDADTMMVQEENDIAIATECLRLFHVVRSWELPLFAAPHIPMDIIPDFGEPAF